MINKFIKQSLLTEFYSKLGNNEIQSMYLSFPIKKRNGKTRWISAPDETLKQIQKSILHNILYKFKPHKCCVGFTPGKGIKEGASRHLNSASVLNIDIKDFFHSVPKQEISKVLLKSTLWLLRQSHKNPSDIEKNFIEELFNLVTVNNHLPQGAPTSPYLSNLAFFPIDCTLYRYSNLHNLVYTRYADDLSFSSKDKKVDMYRPLQEIIILLRNHGYKINNTKTRIQRKHKQMTVTGVVVNKVTSVPKWKRKNIRAAIHNYSVKGIPISEKEKERLVGYCEWINQLNSDHGKKLKEKAILL